MCIWPPPYLRARLLDAMHHGQSVNVVALSSEQPLATSNSSSQREGIGSPAVASSTLHRVALRLYPVLVDPISSYYPLAFAFEAFVAAYLLRSKERTLILPLVLLIASLLLGYEQIWHLQMLWVTFILVLWMAWDTHGNPLGLSHQSILSGLLSSVCIFQLPWTLGAIRYEIHHSTYPADEAAQYMTMLLPSNRIGGIGLAFTLRPYFAQEIFIAYSEMDVSYEVALHPDVIVGDSKMSRLETEQLSIAGYHPVQSFCGASYFPNKPIRPVCLIFFNKT